MFLPVPADPQTPAARVWTLAQDAAADGSPRGIAGTLLTMAVVCVPLYLLMWWPQKRDRDRRAKLLAGLKKNDRVVTAGGLIGRVAAVPGDGPEVTVKFGDAVRIPVLRSRIEAVLDAPAAQPGGPQPAAG